jgi:hypothetical protein
MNGMCRNMADERNKYINLGENSEGPLEDTQFDSRII